MTARKIRILIVDDDSDARGLLRLSLTALADTIVEAVDGVDALQQCQEALPDLVVTDVMMPNMTGTEFVARLHAQYPEKFIPVLMLTALGEVDEKVEGLTAGANDYLTKPFHFNELYARVQSLLRIKNLTEQLQSYAQKLEALNAELSRTQEALVQKERQLVGVQLAGAAAHSLGQPVTAILLNCRMLQPLVRQASDEDAVLALTAIEGECRVIKDIIIKLRSVDANRTQEYLGATKIIDFDPSASEAREGSTTRNPKSQ